MKQPVIRSKRQSDGFFADFNATLTSTIDLRGLIERVSAQLASHVGAKDVSMFIYSKDNHVISGGTDGHARVPKADAHAIDKYIDEDTALILTSRLDKDSRLRRLLVSHGIAIVLALRSTHELVGYVFVGQPVGHYSMKDRKVLVSIAGELSIAVQNALSIHEIRELNATLQERIDTATRELRTSNAQLQRLDKAKDEFVSMASHQLRTPLTSVKGYISMVIEGDAGKISDTQKQLLTEAFNSSERMVRLIGDFLNVSRLQTGKFIIDAHPTDLAKVIEQELDGLGTNARSRNLTFSYTPPKNLPLLNIDEGKIRQVIMNFSDNAMYYSKEGSAIKVALNVDGPDVVFSVKDTGIGVPKNEQAQLFGKFYRASNARKQRPDGTGVGLFLAKKVIDAQGGSVEFSSDEGKGSTFGFRLPIQKLRVPEDTN
jgi:signal transduction histidine kinase